MEKPHTEYDCRRRNRVGLDLLLNLSSSVGDLAQHETTIGLAGRSNGFESLKSFALGLALGCDDHVTNAAHVVELDINVASDDDTKVVWTFAPTAFKLVSLEKNDSCEQFWDRGGGWENATYRR